MRKKVCVVTATRAEYGLLSSVIKEIKTDQFLELLLIVTGTHLEPSFGETYREIEFDGIKQFLKVPIIVDDSEIGVIKTMANALERIGTVLSKERPDIVVLLGDRYEILPIASACVVLNIPIAHISGGEISQGAYDEYIRHAVTKLSWLHFASTEEYRRRIIQMGEQPNRVFNVGDLGVENVKKLDYISKAEMSKIIGMEIGNSLLQVSFYPETLSRNSYNQFAVLLEVLDERNEFQVVFTKSNADQGGKQINELIDQFVTLHPQRSKAFESLGYHKFLNLLRYSIGIVGNSSSGIVEAPSLKIATINIGDRQKGRIRANSIIDCSACKEEIMAALDKISSDAFKNSLAQLINPYCAGNTAKDIVSIIKDRIINQYNQNYVKEFYNIIGDFNVQKK